MNARQSIPVLWRTGIITLVGLLVMVAIGSMIPAGSALAQEEMPKLGIQPAESDDIFFSEKLKAGASKTLKVELSNTGKADVAILTYAADVYALVNGGLGVKLSDEETSGTTTWLDYPVQTFELPHGEGVIIDFTISVPENVEPGEYVTSLVIQNAKPIEGSGGVAMNQILRQAIAVAVTVPGDEQPGLEIGEIAYHDNPLIDSLMIEVRNTGNIHLKPTGTVRVVDQAGISILDVPVGMDSVYAGMSTMLEIGLAQPIPSGEYRVTVDLKDSTRGGEAAVQDLPVTVVDIAQVSMAPRIEMLEVTPIRASDDAPVQFANVSIAIEQPERIDQGQVVLHVEHDGELVEDYPLTLSGPIDIGRAEYQLRYLPLTGWQSGEYTFVVQVVSFDPGTGESTLLVESEAPVVLEIE